MTINAIGNNSCSLKHPDEPNHAENRWAAMMLYQWPHRDAARPEPSFAELP